MKKLEFDEFKKQIDKLETFYVTIVESDYNWQDELIGKERSL